MRDREASFINSACSGYSETKISESKSVDRLVNCQGQKFYVVEDGIS